MRHPLTCAEGGGRVTTRRDCRMLFKGLVHGYLNPIRDSRWVVRLLGLCKCETTHLGTLTPPKTTQAVLSRKKEGSEGSYTSEEANFTRERCIRVAAIIIMITPGNSNNWGVEKKKEKSRVSPQRLQRNIRCVMDLIFRRESSPMISYQR
jgi:hypothetical protein